MKHVWRGTMVVSAFVLALVGGSCASSNMLESSQGDVTFQITSTSPSTTYPWERLIIGQMTFVPSTPGGALSDPIAMLPTAASVNLNGNYSVPPLRVTAQTYVLNPFQAAFELNVVDMQPVSISGQSGTCSGGVLQDLRTKDGEQSTIAPTCTFTVRTGSTTAIVTNVDSVGLAGLLQSKYNCATNSYTPPTSAEILQFLQFQCEP